MKHILLEKIAVLFVTINLCFSGCIITKTDLDHIIGYTIGNSLESITPIMVFSIVSVRYYESRNEWPMQIDTINKYAIDNELELSIENIEFLNYNVNSDGNLEVDLLYFGDRGHLTIEKPKENGESKVFAKYTSLIGSDKFTAEGYITIRLGESDEEKNGFNLSPSQPDPDESGQAVK